MNCFQSLAMVSAFMVTHSTYKPESPTLTGETISDSDLYRTLLQKIGPLPFVSIFVDLSQYPAKLNTFWQKPYFNILALPHPQLRFGHTKQIFTKTQLHFYQAIPQVRIKSSFPRQQTNGFNVPLDEIFILHGESVMTDLGWGNLTDSVYYSFFQGFFKVYMGNLDTQNNAHNLFLVRNF